jgi:hypothetical protein
VNVGEYGDAHARTLAVWLRFRAVATEPDNRTSLRSALDPGALREAMVVRRPVFANPWDSTGDMGLCYLAVAVLDPFLLWVGGKLMGAIFGFSSHWPLGVFMVAALVGAAGLMTIVGRQRTSIAVDVLTITAWVLLGLVVAPIFGLAFSPLVAIICYAIMLAGIFVYVLRFGRFEVAFLRTISWPITWSLLALFFAFCAHQLVLYQ